METGTKSRGCKDQPKTCCVSVIDEHGVPSDVFGFFCFFSHRMFYILQFLVGAATFLSMQMRSFVPKCENSDNSRNKRTAGIKLTMHNCQSYYQTWWWLASITFHTSCSFILNNKNMVTFSINRSLWLPRVTKSVLNNNDKRTTFKCSFYEKRLRTNHMQERTMKMSADSIRLTEAPPKNTHKTEVCVSCCFAIFHPTFHY